MKIEEYSDAELRYKALSLLMKQLGAADTLRFLSRYQSHSSNYEEIRNQLFEGITAKSFFEEAKNFWEKSNGKT
jgi:hypothetical protein